MESDEIEREDERERVSDGEACLERCVLGLGRLHWLSEIWAAVVYYGSKRRL